MDSTALQHTIRVMVRYYEMDPLGHVNNAVYLNYAEEAAIEHVRQLGFGETRWQELGGAWVVRRHEIDYHRPAVAGDELEVTTRIEDITQVRARRRTRILRLGDNALIAEAVTQWVWVGLDGRPHRLPGELLAAFRLAIGQ